MSSRIRCTFQVPCVCVVITIETCLCSHRVDLHHVCASALTYVIRDVKISKTIPAVPISSRRNYSKSRIRRMTSFFDHIMDFGGPFVSGGSSGCVAWLSWNMPRGGQIMHGVYLLSSGRSHSFGLCVRTFSNRLHGGSQAL